MLAPFTLPAFDRWEAAFAPYATAGIPGVRSDGVAARPFRAAVRTETPRVHHLLLAEAPARGLTERALGGGPVHFSDAALRPGDLVLYSPEAAQAPRVTSWREPFRFVALALLTDLLNPACEAVDLDPDRVRHLDRFPTSEGGVSDPLLAALVCALAAHLLRAAPDARLYAEALLHAIASHLVQAHTAEGRAPSVYVGGISAYQRRAVEAAVRADLSAAHSLGSLAAHAGLSPYHFARAFKRTTGETVHGFVRRLRIEHAGRLLRETGAPVSEVAVEVGYASASRFASAFQRVVGCGPLAYRRV